MRKFFKGTAIQSQDIFQYNWVHIEDFSDLSISREDELKPAPKDNIISGLPIGFAPGGEHLWTITSTTADAVLKHYVFILTYKTLTVAPGMIEVRTSPPK